VLARNNGRARGHSGPPASDSGHVKSLPEKLRLLAASARVANLPSVASNVFPGIALAMMAGHSTFNQTLAVPATLLIISGACLYLAGNFLNDWADRKWDAFHRPERALPQEVFSSSFYLTLACGLGLLGLCTAAAVHTRSLIIALVITASIILYTWAHKRAGWSVIPMGLCRALLPGLGFSGFAPPWLASPALAAIALGLFCHITGLSLSARAESVAEAPTGLLRFARLLFLPAGLSVFLASWLGLSCPLSASVSGLLPYVLWITLCLTIFRKPIHVYVSNLLAGIPLVDWIVLLPLGLTHSAAQGHEPFFIACMIIPPLAFLSGKALQRLAPAT
jgi:4-hydroxybenzoate polyprenyltransferase